MKIKCRNLLGMFGSKVGSNIIANTNHLLTVKGLVLSILVVSSAIPFFLMVPEASPTIAQPSVIETISGLPDAADIAYDPVHERMYVTGENSGNVYIIDVHTNMETSNSPITLPSGSLPNEIAYDPEHARMYVTDFSPANNVYVINANNVMETPIIIPFGQATGGIAYNPDNQMMYVAANDCACIKMIDTDDNTVDPIPISLPPGLGTPWGIAYDPDHHRMYVTRLGVGYVEIIDTTTDTLDTTHGPVDVGGNPFGIAYDPVHQTMYVTNSASDSVSIIDTDTGMDPNEVITTINDITHANGISYDPANEEMYVTEWLAIFPSNVRVIDTNTNALVGNPIPVGSLPEGIAYEPLHGRMYVANFGSSSVSVIQITTVTTTINSAIDGNGSPVTNGGSTTSDDITFTFSATATPPSTVAGFQCSLDGAAFSTCSSPQAFNNLPPGPHKVDIRAIDESGNIEVPPVRFTWTIVAQPSPPSPPPASACIGTGSGNSPITGTNGPDTLIGTSAPNSMNGLGGNDAMNGCDGSDSVNGNTGNDGVAGGTGDDRVRGNEGDDIVQGDAGNDAVVGDSGVDTLTGGPGSDAFICSPEGDTVTDFQPGIDRKSGNCILAPATATAATTAASGR